MFNIYSVSTQGRGGSPHLTWCQRPAEENAEGGRSSLSFLPSPKLLSQPLLPQRKNKYNMIRFLNGLHTTELERDKSLPNVLRDSRFICYPLTKNYLQYSGIKITPIKITVLQRIFFSLDHLSVNSTMFLLPLPNALILPHRHSLYTLQPSSLKLTGELLVSNGEAPLRFHCMLWLVCPTVPKDTVHLT